MAEWVAKDQAGRLVHYIPLPLKEHEADLAGRQTDLDVPSIFLEKRKCPCYITV